MKAAREPTRARELPALRAGAVVAARYAIDGLLATGGMSLVFRAHDLRLKRPVAIKVLRDAGARQVGRLLREAHAIAELRSDHVVRVLDVDAAAEPPYLAMELLEGPTVAELVESRHSFPIETAVRIVAQACRGVADAHAVGVMHRDLKPSNLIVTTLPGGTNRVKVIDFGIAKRLFRDDEPALTASGQIVGSPRYMAPEQVRGAEPDARTDVWALGAILYELVTGGPAYDAPTIADTLARIAGEYSPPSLRSRVPEASERVSAIVSLCLSKEAALRPPSVASLLEELEATLPDAPLRIDGLDEASLERSTTMAAQTPSPDTGRLFSTPAPRPRDVITATQRLGDSFVSETPGSASARAPATGRTRVVIGVLAIMAVLGSALALRVRMLPSPPETQRAALEARPALSLELAPHASALSIASSPEAVPAEAPPAAPQTSARVSPARAPSPRAPAKPAKPAKPSSPSLYEELELNRRD